METRAPFIVVGAFVLAAIGAVFGFVYWLHNTAGSGERTIHHVQFNGSVSGLLVGAAVLFNGIRVGEITDLGLVNGSPRRVSATIAVVTGTPIAADTKVGLDFQGLTGVPVIALEGGDEIAGSNESLTLVADAAAGQSMTDAARNALGRIDSVLADNAGPLKSTIANLNVFTSGLAKNTGGLDAIVAGLERMTASSATTQQKTIYDLRAAETFPSPKKTLKTQLAIPVPTAILMLDTQKFLLASGSEAPDLANAQWSDSLPALVQAKLVESFENYDIDHAALRSTDGFEAEYTLLIDIRTFQVETDPKNVAEIGFSANILAKDGHVVASRIFSQRKQFDKIDAPSASAAFNDAFASIVTELIGWTADAI